MANLIDQMNILKGLDDQSLGAELNRPSGAVPPYLVMSEISRRKDMRQRYQGQLAQQQPATTVLQDQLSALAPPSGVAAGQGASPAMPGGFGSSPAGSGAPMPAPPMGISAAPQTPPTGYRQGGIVHYAGGGLVGDPSSYWLDPDQSVDDTVNLPVSAGAPALSSDMNTILPSGYMSGIDASGINVPSQNLDPALLAQLPIDNSTPAYAGVAAGGVAPAAPNVDYSAVSDKYNKELAQAQHAQDQAPWLAMMQAGLAIAGGTSPYALSNIGNGGATGLDSYTALRKNATGETNAALAGLTDIQKAQLDQQNVQFNQNISSQDLALKQQAAAAAADPASPQNQSTLIKSINAVNAMPEGPDKDAAMAMIQPAAVAAVEQKKTMAHDIVDQMYAGKTAPDLSKMYGMAPYILSDMAKSHPDFNMQQANLDYQGQVANVKAMNGNMQLQQRQVIDATSASLGALQDAADKWNNAVGSIAPLNAANLSAARAGAGVFAGLSADSREAAQEAATTFDAQLADTSTQLSSVFRNGRTPTDASLANAEKMFNQDVSAKAFDNLIGVARRNLGYRAAALGQPAQLAPPAVNGGLPVSSPTAGATPAAAAGGPVKITGDADYNALPSGTPFVGPDGVPRRKP